MKNVLKVISMLVALNACALLKLRYPAPSKFYGQLKVHDPEYLSSKFDPYDPYVYFRTFFETIFRKQFLLKLDQEENLDLLIEHLSTRYEPSINLGCIQSDNIISSIVAMWSSTDPITRAFGDLALSVIASIDPKIARNMIKRQNMILQLKHCPEIVAAIARYDPECPTSESFCTPDTILVEAEYDSEEIVEYLNSKGANLSGKYCLPVVSLEKELYHTHCYGHDTPLLWGKLSHMVKETAAVIELWNAEAIKKHKDNKMLVTDYMLSHLLYLLLYSSYLPSHVVTAIETELNRLRKDNENFPSELTDFICLAGQFHDVLSHDVLVGNLVLRLNSMFRNDDIVGKHMQRIAFFKGQYSPQVSHLMCFKNLNGKHSPIPFVFRGHNIVINPSELALSIVQVELLNNLNVIIANFPLPLQSAMSGSNIIYADVHPNKQDLYLCTDDNERILVTASDSLDILKGKFEAQFKKRTPFYFNIND